MTTKHSLSTEDLPVWWEVWLPVRQDREAVVSAFRDRAGLQDIRLAQGELRFPERTIVLVQATVEQMRASMVTLNSIAELRRPKETAEFFDSLDPAEQLEWLEDLLARTRYRSSDEDVPYVCLLDTGVNRGHQLLAPALATEGPSHGRARLGNGRRRWSRHGDGRTRARWGLDRPTRRKRAGRIRAPTRVGEAAAQGWRHRHRSQAPRIPDHSKQLLAPKSPLRGTDEYSVWPSRLETIGIKGRPSAWSSALDALAADSGDQGGHPRLLVVSAGNVDDPIAWRNYPASNDSDGIHDPAQAWNALTVGACTDLVRITEPNCQWTCAPIAPKGGLSPFSTTSLPWQRYWPLKPDIVMEGGNVAEDSVGAVTVPSLSLLTTHYRPALRSFTTSHATSAATALASRLAAQVMGAYPDLWPETVRGLIVHSAEWTDAMKDAYLPRKLGVH